MTGPISGSFLKRRVERAQVVVEVQREAHPVDRVARRPRATRASARSRTAPPTGQARTSAGSSPWWIDAHEPGARAAARSRRAAAGGMRYGPIGRTSCSTTAAEGGQLALEHVHVDEERAPAGDLERRSPRLRAPQPIPRRGAPAERRSTRTSMSVATPARKPPVAAIGGRRQRRVASRRSIGRGSVGEHRQVRSLLGRRRVGAVRVSLARHRVGRVYSGYSSR